MVQDFSMYPSSAFPAVNIYDAFFNNKYQHVDIIFISIFYLLEIIERVPIWWSTPQMPTMAGGQCSSQELNPVLHVCSRCTTTWVISCIASVPWVSWSQKPALGGKPRCSDVGASAGVSTGKTLMPVTLLLTEVHAFIKYSQLLPCVLCCKSHPRYHIKFDTQIVAVMRLGMNGSRMDQVTSTSLFRTKVDPDNCVGVMFNEHFHHLTSSLTLTITVLVPWVESLHIKKISMHLFLST